MNFFFGSLMVIELSPGVRKAMVCAILSWMVHITGPLMLIRKSRSWSGDNGLPLLISEWSFTIHLKLYYCEYNVLNAWFIKIFPSFHLHFYKFVTQTDICLYYESLFSQINNLKVYISWM